MRQELVVDPPFGNHEFVENQGQEAAAQHEEDAEEESFPHAAERPRPGAPMPPFLLIKAKSQWQGKTLRFSKDRAGLPTRNMLKRDGDLRLETGRHAHARVGMSERAQLPTL